MRSLKHTVIYSFLILAAMLAAHNATAVVYYWTTPPGTTLWAEGVAITGSDSLNINDPLSTTLDLTNSGTVEVNNTFTVNTNITSNGEINVNSGKTMQFAGATLSCPNTINNLAGGTLILPAPLVLTLLTDISNDGAMTFAGQTLNNNVGITNFANGTISFISGASTGAISNFSNTTLTVDNDITVNSFFNHANLVVAANIAGSNLDNESGGSLEFATNAATNSLISNFGTFDVTGDSSTTQRINNYSIMNVKALLGGGGPSVHNQDPSAVLSVNSGGTIETTVFNDDGILNLNGGAVGGIQNFATVEIIAPSFITNAGFSNSSGTVHMNSDLDLASNTFTNNNVVNVSGANQITNGNLISDGILNFTITNATVNDSLSVDGDIDISGGTVAITSGFSGAGGSSFNWDILSSATNLITDGGTVINIPADTAFEQWSSQIIANTILRLFYINSAASVTPLPGVATEIADVLATMQANVTNAGQTELLAAVNSVTTQDLYNYLLSNLEPDTNNSSSSVTLAMQNIGFDKIESRVAGTGHKTRLQGNRKKRNHSKKSARKRATNSSGIASGDLTPNTAMWLSGFGSLSKQHAKGDNQGYRAKILGGMLGIDTRAKNDDVYGIALGISNANVYGLENTTFNTRILGYNLMLYGANNLKRNFFAEWIVSGVINKNHGVRVFGVNGIDLSTSSSYHGALAGARFTLGKNFRLNNIFNLSQVNSIQYVLVHQPSYNEGGSVAALHVSTKENQSILTLGTGFRLGVFNYAPWREGNRELHAMVTYDVISPQQATTANFVVGSDSFIMTSSAVRLALKLGADYSFMLAKKLSLQFSYDYEVRSGYYDNFGEVKLRYVF